MAITPRRIVIRKAFAVSALAIAATALGASSPIASAAPATPAAGFTTLDTAANWAIAKAAASTGYAVSDTFAASCGAKN